MPDERTRGNALQRGLEVLAVLAKQGEVGFSDLARHLGVANTVASRLLRGLAAADWIERTPGGRYRLGSAHGRLLPHAGLRERGVALAQPVLDSLRDLTGNTIVLIVEEQGPEGPYLRCAAKAAHEDSCGMQPIGAIRTAYLGHPWAWIFLDRHDPATRAALIAGQADREAWLPRYAAGRALLAQEGCNRLEMSGTVRLAAPVFDAQGVLRAAIGMGVNRPALVADEDQRCRRALLSAAHALGKAWV